MIGMGPVSRRRKTSHIGVDFSGSSFWKSSQVSWLAHVVDTTCVEWTSENVYLAPLGQQLFCALRCQAVMRRLRKNFVGFVMLIMRASRILGGCPNNVTLVLFLLPVTAMQVLTDPRHFLRDPPGGQDRRIAPFVGRASHVRTPTGASGVGGGAAHFIAAAVVAHIHRHPHKVHDGRALICRDERHLVRSDVTRLSRPTRGAAAFFLYRF